MSSGHDDDIILESSEYSAAEIEVLQNGSTRECLRVLSATDRFLVYWLPWIIFITAVAGVYFFRGLFPEGFFVAQGSFVVSGIAVIYPDISLNLMELGAEAGMTEAGTTMGFLNLFSFFFSIAVALPIAAALNVVSSARFPITIICLVLYFGIPSFILMKSRDIVGILNVGLNVDTYWFVLLGVLLLLLLWGFFSKSVFEKIAEKAIQRAILNKMR